MACPKAGIMDAEPVKAAGGCIMMAAERLAVDQFRQAIEAAGLTAPDRIVADGKLHRFASNGAPHDDAGWYVLHDDGVPAGMFGCWRSSVSQTWCGKSDQQLTEAERTEHRRRVNAAKQQREADEQLRQLSAAATAKTLWDMAVPASAEHPYLKRKGVQPHGLHVSDDNRLIVPVLINDAISSVQFINENGDKRFLPGGAVKGGAYLIGDLSKTTAILVAEGFATGASLHEATGFPVVVAYNAGNLLPVAQQVRQAYPHASIVLCADNDCHADGTTNIGRLAATAAAMAIRGLVATPETIDHHATDWNDVHVQRGLEAVRAGIDGALSEGNPAMDTTTSPGLEAAVLEYRQLVALDLPERKRHLAWLPEGGNVMVYAMRGVGKTWFSLGLAASLVSGADFLRWRVNDAVGVLYIDGEMQLEELRQRETALLRQPPKSPLFVLSGEMVYRTLQRDLVLTSEEVRDEIIRILDAHPEIRVIVVDNISCLFAGIDEDKKRDWEPIAAWLIRLRHRGLATILVHHAGKGGQQRGTSGREDGLDTVIHLAEPAGHEAADGCHFEVTFTKSRSVKGPDVAPLDVRLTEQNGQLTWTHQPLEISKLDEVRQLIADGLTGDVVIAEAAGISRTYAFKLRKRLEQEGAV